MKSNMRRLIIDKLLTQKGYVSFEQIKSVLKVSEPTVKRDIRYMREELGAPIQYSHAKNGYYYAAPAAEGKAKRGARGADRRPQEKDEAASPLMHKQWYSSEELYVLASAYDLLGALEGDQSSALVEEITPLRSRVLGLFSLGGSSPRELVRHVRVVNGRVPFKEPQTFETIGCALSERRRVRIRYYSWRTDESTEREISPLRLVHYRNRWYVDAFCHLTGQLKTFQIENIESAEILELQIARLHFDEASARYVLREAWHPRQRVQKLNDGSLMLSVPYSDPTEIVGAILGWGSRVEVLEPQELRDQVGREAERIAALYSGRTDAGS